MQGKDKKNKDLIPSSKGISEKISDLMKQVIHDREQLKKCMILNQVIHARRESVQNNI